MKTYDLYGIDATDLDAARRLVEGLLELRLVAHESSYHCGDYYRLGDVGAENFILQHNYDSFEVEWTEPEFQEKKFLLYVNETSRSAHIAAALTTDQSVKLLRHQALE